MSEPLPVTHDIGCGPIAVLVDSSFEALIPRFMANRTKEIAAMTEALVHHDYETIKRIAHGMKGVSGSYGFPALTTIAAQVEQAASVADSASIHKDLAVLQSYLERVVISYE
ncbi:MAG: Hpt domain-containing protein [Nitrospira sp.]|nr:Hpt domain-containing protein [Nitrospira sp.]